MYSQNEISLAIAISIRYACSMGTTSKHYGFIRDLRGQVVCWLAEHILITHAKESHLWLHGVVW